MITALVLWVAFAAPPTVSDGSPQAQAPPFELGWDAPANCPSAPNVRGRIEQHLGASVDEAGGRGLVVHARIDETQGGYQTVLEMTRDGERRTRTLPVSPTCEEASQAAALIVAIAIDPTVGTRIPEPDPTPTESVPEPEPPSGTSERPAPTTQAPPPARDAPAPVPPPVEPPARPKPPEARPAITGFVGVRGGLTYGDQPWPSGTVGIAGGLLGRLFRVELEARYAPQHDRALEDASVRFQMWFLGVAAGPRFAARPWLDLWACAGVEAGQSRVDPTGLGNASVGREPWLAATVRPALAFLPIRRLALGLAPELVVPFTRPAYEVGPLGTIHQPTAVAIRALLALEVRLP